MWDAVRNGSPGASEEQKRSLLGAQVLLTGKQRCGGGDGERSDCRAGVSRRRREDAGMQVGW